MKTWEINKAWSDKYIPEIKHILGLYLIGEAPQEEDACRNTDLIVLRLESVRIGCRIRRPGYADIYGNEFTIRTSRPSGMKTELTKIIEGWGDYFFYGHAGNDGLLSAWALCDLKSFRLWFGRYIAKNNGHLPGKLQKNKDGSSNFRAFKFSCMPDSFVVARKVYTEETETRV